MCLGRRQTQPQNCSPELHGCDFYEKCGPTYAHSSKRKVEAASLEVFGEVSEAVLVVGEVVSLLEEGVEARLGGECGSEI